MQKRWRCMVCGYVHSGETAPDVCPVCGVGPDKFEQMEDVQEEEPQLSGAKGLLKEMTDSFMPHAVMAHFPNALLPTLALFLVLYLVGGLKTLDHGIYLLLALVPLSALFTLATGIYSWKKHYAGAKSKIFHRKLVLGVSLVLICFEMLLLRYNNAELLTSFSVTTLFFLALAGGALFCVTMLGHYGGMLVFGHVEKSRGNFE
jgi:rubredoxin